MFRIKLIKFASLLAIPFVCGGSALANGIIGNPGRYDGGSLGVQTQTGTNCSSSAPDRASISTVVGNRTRDYDGYRGSYGSSDSNDLVGGVIVTIPFGGRQLGDCSALLEMEEQRARLDLAMTLFEAGAMTAEEIKLLAEEVKGIAEMPGASGKGLEEALDEVSDQY